MSEDRLVNELEIALEKLDAEFIVMGGQQITFRFDVIQSVRNKIRRVRNVLVRGALAPELTPGRGGDNA